MKPSRVARRLLFVAIAVFAPAAFAWDGHTEAKIAVIEVTSLTNYPFRMWLEGAPVMCTGGHKWAYVDGANSNYKVLVSTLLMAKARGAAVSVYTLNDYSGGNNCCRIEHIATISSITFSARVRSRISSLRLGIIRLRGSGPRTSGVSYLETRWIT